MPSIVLGIIWFSRLSCKDSCKLGVISIILLQSRKLSLWDDFIYCDICKLIFSQSFYLSLLWVFPDIKPYFSRSLTNKGSFEFYKEGPRSLFSQIAFLQVSLYSEQISMKKLNYIYISTLWDWRLESLPECQPNFPIILLRIWIFLSDNQEKGTASWTLWPTLRFFLFHFSDILFYS